MGDFCENFHLIAKGRKADDDTLFVSRLRCKMWSCDYCARKNRGMWRYHLTQWITRHTDAGNWSFWTVTAHRNAKTAATSIANLRGGLDRLLKRARRIYKRMEYVRVFEKHAPKSGNVRFHAHMLVYTPGHILDGKKATRWLKDNAAACGMGHQAKVIPVRPDAEPQMVAWYITKYMTKDVQSAIELPKYTRRIQTSLGIGIPKPKADADMLWTIGVALWKHEAARYRRVYDTQKRENVDPAYWDSHEAYPGSEDE